MSAGENFVEPGGDAVAGESADGAVFGGSLVKVGFVEDDQIRFGALAFEEEGDVGMGEIGGAGGIDNDGEWS